MTDDQRYAQYMLCWIDAFDWPDVDVAAECLPQLKAHWAGHSQADLECISRRLWEWFDSNRAADALALADKRMLLVRMLICLAWPKSADLKDQGFFEDLLAHAGVSKFEMLFHGPTRPPRKRLQ